MPYFAPSALAFFSIFNFAQGFGLSTLSRGLSNDGYSQIGSSVFGEVRFNTSLTNNFGAAVSLTPDGLHLAVGATSHDLSTTSQGNGGIFLYDYVNSDWTLSTSIVGDATEGIGDRFSISRDATRVAVRRRPSNRVDVFQSGDKIGPSIGNCTGTGNTVSISPDGNRVAVSCELVNTQAGLVEVFQWDQAQSDWELMETIDGRVLGDETRNFFGWATAFDASGNRLAISAIFQNYEGDVNVGAIHVLDYNATSSAWEPLSPPLFGKTNRGRFGASLDLNDDGTTLIVGAPTAPTTPTTPATPTSSVDDPEGEVRVYQLNNSNEWVLKGSAIPGDILGDEFGRSVALSSDGSRFAASSGKHDSNRGQVKLFEYSGNDWVQVGGDIDGLNEGDEFGLGINSVGLSGDGLRVASAGWKGRNDNGIVTGRARVLEDLGLSEPPSAVPSNVPSNVPSAAPSLSSLLSQSPTTGAPVSQDTAIPTVPLGKFDWDLDRTGNVSVAFDKDSATEEIVLAYNISLREAVISILDINCQNRVGEALVSVGQQTTFTSSTHGELKVSLDIKQDSVVGSSIWRDAQTTGEGYIDFCVRVDLILGDGSSESVNFHEQKLYLTIGLSQGFSVDNIDLDRDDADLDNQDVQAEYGLESCQCNSTFACTTDALVQGDDVYICIFSVDSDIEINAIEELDFVQDGVGGLVVPAIDNSTEDALTAVLQLGKIAVIRSQMRSDFFDEESPGNVVASGIAAITFVNGTAGRTRRNLRVVPRELQEVDSTDFAVTMFLVSDGESVDIDSDAEGNKGSGALVGGVVGGLAGLALVVVAVVMRRKKDDEDDLVVRDCDSNMGDDL